MISEEEKIKAKLAYKHKLALLKTDILKKVRSELDGFNSDVPTLMVVEAFQKKLKADRNLDKKEADDVEMSNINVNKDNQMSMLVSEADVFKTTRNTKKHVEEHSDSSIITHQSCAEEVSQKDNDIKANETNNSANTSSSFTKTSVQGESVIEKPKKKHVAAKRQHMTKKKHTGRQRRKSILGLADSGSTESNEEQKITREKPKKKKKNKKFNLNTIVQSFIDPESDCSAITDSMSFFNKK